MTFLSFILILLVGAYLAGLLGSLTGLGGGVVIIPLLSLGFQFDMRYAIGAALVASIATSSGSASAYVREGITNIRMGMFLEIATTLGAVIGTAIAIFMPVNSIAIIFACVLIFSAVMMIRKSADHIPVESSKLARLLKLNGSYPTKQGNVHYNVTHVSAGFSIMSFAGILSGLLGIGSGALKVLAMDSAMKVPFKVSTTTSNFMIGVTAATGAVVYLQRGYIAPIIACPVIIGVLAGALTGSKLLVHIHVRWLKIIFSIAISLVALQMMYNGLNHKF